MSPQSKPIERVRVLHIEDEPFWASYVENLLHQWPEFVFLGVETTGSSALRRCETSPPDVLLLDLRLPDMDGFTILKTLAQRGEVPPVLLLTCRTDDVALREARSKFIFGVLSKSLNLDQMLRPALSQIAERGQYFSPDVQGALRRLYSEPSAYFKILSAREQEVLRLLAVGHTNSEVAAFLGIAFETAHSHRRNVMQKLGIHSTAKLVAWARDRGFG